MIKVDNNGKIAGFVSDQNATFDRRVQIGQKVVVESTINAAQMRARALRAAGEELSMILERIQKAAVEGMFSVRINLNELTHLKEPVHNFRSEPVSVPNKYIYDTLNDRGFKVKFDLLSQVEISW